MNHYLIKISAFLLLTLGACTYTQKIRDGQTAYDRRQYAVAVGFFEKEFKKAERRTEKGKIAYHLGMSYLKNQLVESSLPWFKISYENGFGVDALKEYALALKRLERYDEALEAFEQLGVEIGSPYEYRKEITACKVAADWKKLQRPDYQIELLPFNSAQSDFSPTLYRENEILFASDRAGATGEEKYQWTGRKFMDFYVAEKNSQSPTPLSDGFNTAENEGTATFNADYTEIFFTRCGGDVDNTAFCKILFSQKNGDNWTAPKMLAFEEEKVNYMHPVLSSDGNMLYFASNHPDGWGGYDIYASERTPDGWDIPKLLSRNINTSGNEVFPFTDRDTLYFSSDAHTGMGGLDVFKVNKIDKNNWSAPQNLMPPINSGADDFGFVIDARGKRESDVLQKGYFSSNRPGGAGADDIYAFKKIIPPPDAVPEVAEKEPVYKMILNVFVLEKIFQDPADPNSKILGRRPLSEAALTYKIGREEQNFKTGAEGFLTIELLENTDYRFFASKENYLSGEAFFSTKGIGKDPKNPEVTYELEIVLDKIFKNKEITLENIYYDFDKWDIRDDAKPTLDQLAKNLILNPQIRIQLASHTDCRGNDRYNEDLSQKRAQSAVDYLIQKGISPDRLIAKGYGESAPAVECFCNRCTEDQHQSNRRTTFTILE